MFNVNDYGTTGNGTTDDRVAIQDAINAAKAAGGGVVYFPKGTYRLASSEMVTLSTSPFVETPVCLVIDEDNIHLRGEGVGVSILKLANGTNAKVVGFGHCKNNSIEKIEIDGNRTNQTVDGIPLYSFGDLTNFTVRDVFCHHSIDYGIGLQHGKLKNILLENVLIEDTGQDGFDNKNHDGGDLYNRMSNVTVRRAGLNTALSGQACIDLRGKWVVNNLICEDFNHTSARCKTGVRFRPDNPSDGAIGGSFSVGSNIQVNPGSTGGTIGIEINASRVSISSALVQNCGTGVLANNTENSINGVIAVDCTDGFVADTSSTTTGDRNIFNGCVARGCTSGFKILTPKNVLNGIATMSNVHGVNLRNGSSNTVISGVSTSNNGGSNLQQESTSCTWTSGFVK